MFSPPSRAIAAALYRRVEEESSEFSSRLTTHAANDNMTLNRWHNILPYDSTRVVITQQSSVNNKSNTGNFSELNSCALRSDYINANHVRVPEAAKHYILTQGPIDKDDQRQRTLSSSMMLMLGNTGGGNVRSETVQHFWTMAWQQNSPAIVMLCRTHERDAYGCLQCKCARYWPKSISEADNIHVFDLEVRLLEEKKLTLLKPTGTVKNSSPSTAEKNNESVSAENMSNECTVMRKLELYHKLTNEKKIVAQYHYQKWPDFGVPEGKEVHNFLNLVNIVAKEYPSSEDFPNIIHCSAGVGRSGTFCLVDSCLARMAKTGVPITQQEVIDTLLNMRRQRMGLIQTDDQLRFALSAILAGANDALGRENPCKSINDLKSNSNTLTDVPCNSSYSKLNSSQTISIKDSSSCKENGLSISKSEVEGKKCHHVVSLDGIRSISSNGKTRTIDGSIACNIARKRSTDLGADDEFDNSPSKLSDKGGIDATEFNESLEDKVRNTSSDNTSARSTAKRKKSEKDC